MKRYKILADEIILQAVLDYRKALRGIPVHKYVPIGKDAIEYAIEDCETFFQSEWFGILTKIDGRSLMLKLQEEARNESKSYPKYKSPNRHHR